MTFQFRARYPNVGATEWTRCEAISHNPYFNMKTLHGRA